MTRAPGCPESPAALTVAGLAGLTVEALMTEARARLYLAAACDDPLVAAWVSILDAHRLPPRAEIARFDWQDAFGDLFNHGLVADDFFNAVDFKRDLNAITPSACVIDQALDRLTDLRAQAHLETLRMDKFDPFADSKALTLPGSEPRRSLTRHEGLTPLAPTKPPLFDLAPAPPSSVPSLAPITRSSRSSALGPVAGARRAVERGLPCQEVEDEEAPPGDPRTYIEGFNVQLYCCGKEVRLEYENGEELHEQEANSDCVLVEFMLYGECPTCQSQKHLHEIRRLPLAAWVEP
jgi:hypothetical protein